MRKIAIFISLVILLYLVGCSTRSTTEDKIRQIPYDSFFQLVDYLRENYPEMKKTIRKQLYTSVLLRLESERGHEKAMKELWTLVPGRAPDLQGENETNLQGEYLQLKKIIDSCLQREKYKFLSFDLQEFPGSYTYSYVGYINLFFDNVPCEFKTLGGTIQLDTSNTQPSKNQRDVVISLLLAYRSPLNTYGVVGWMMMDCNITTMLGNMEFPKSYFPIEKAKELWEMK